MLINVVYSSIRELERSYDHSWMSWTSGATVIECHTLHHKGLQQLQQEAKLGVIGTVQFNIPLDTL